MLCRMTDMSTRAPGWVPDLSTFGARLALVRQRMGWTNIKEAAVACAISPETWRRWEAGRFEPRQLVNACMKIAGVTGVDYRWLALGPDTRAEAPAATVGVTHGYPTIGQRVIITSGTDRQNAFPHPGPIMRTRPIDQRRPALLAAG